MSSGRADATTVLTREVTEALTALGSWLAAANLELRKSLSPSADTVDRALEQALGQHDRAAKAIRELRGLPRRTAAD